jgi:uncharacterized protein YndB with AHSA1/START domain
MQKFTKLNIEAIVNASLEKVWEYYTQPQHIIHWNFADDSWCCPSAENDLQIGGKYKARMEAKDGSFGFDFEGIYESVVILKNLSYGLEDGRKVIVSFEPIENQTMVKVQFDAETENSLELQKGGWQAILNNYKKYTESL